MQRTEVVNQKEIHGIQALEMLVAWFISLFIQVDKTLEDGKFRWFEIFGFSDELQALAMLTPMIAQMKLEFKDLSLTEKNQLVQFVTDSYGIEQMFAVQAVQHILDVGVSIYLAINVFKDWKQSRKTKVA
jgi:hypothetical protein